MSSSVTRCELPLKFHSDALVQFQGLVVLPVLLDRLPDVPADPEQHPDDDQRHLRAGERIQHG